MATNQFYFDASNLVQFDSAHVQPCVTSVRRRQVLGTDSSNNRYIYGKSNVVTNIYNLQWVGITDAVRLSLLAFLTATDGRRLSFTWYDQLSVAHTVKFTSKGMSFQLLVGGLYSYSTVLREDT